MYKLLLSWRYLRTRFIALASIVSVTLGVATLIVVNSVMAGFIQKMQVRLHGILSDVEIAAPGLGVIYQPDYHVAEVKRVLGDEVDQITTVIRVPALLHFEVNGYPMTHQVMLLGIDDETFSKVTDFSPFLMNEHHREKLEFQLKEDGYDESLGECGWAYRRKMAEFQREAEQQYQSMRAAQAKSAPRKEDFPSERVAASSVSTENSETEPPGQDHSASSQETTNSNLRPLPQGEPDLEQHRDQSASSDGPPSMRDPFDRHLPGPSPDQIFDPARDQHTGIVMGLAIANRKYRDEMTGEMRDALLVRPGDDVDITLPTAGANPNAVRENCTIVDFYHSKMHEYDSSFVFMSLSRLQKLRGMIQPGTGLSSVSAIQIKLKPGADLDAARDALRSRFPPHENSFMIQTWKDTQRPLLSAVNLELTILNILLFLIIAVAGFGILATFFMIVVEKTKDIGILKSLGAPSSGVMSIFLSYGLSLGTVGTGVGIGIGLLIVWFINDIAEWIGNLTGRELFDPTIYYFDEIPTIVSPWMVLWVGVGAVLIAVLASVLPAVRAARLHPVEALRYE